MWGSEDPGSYRRSGRPPWAAPRPREGGGKRGRGERESGPSRAAPKGGVCGLGRATLRAIRRRQVVGEAHWPFEASTSLACAHQIAARRVALLAAAHRPTRGRGMAPATLRADAVTKACPAILRARVCTHPHTEFSSTAGLEVCGRLEPTSAAHGAQGTWDPARTARRRDSSDRKGEVRRNAQGANPLRAAKRKRRGPRGSAPSNDRRGQTHAQNATHRKPQAMGSPKLPSRSRKETVALLCICNALAAPVCACAVRA